MTTTNTQHSNYIFLLAKAASFAAEKHKNQRRKDKEKTPYINHPLTVGEYLIDIGQVYDPVPIIAAYLHDTIEDTDTTYDELRQEFGTTIADIVMELTDDKEQSKLDRKLHVIDHGPHLSNEAKLVKMADMLHNMQSILTSPPTSWSTDQLRGYFIWAYEVYLGIQDASPPQLSEYMRDFFSSTDALEIDGEVYDLIPQDDDEYKELWDRYLDLMTIVNN